MARPPERETEEEEAQPRQKTATLHSDEVNALIYSYLQESGLQHSAFCLLNESHLDQAVTTEGTRVLDTPIPTSHLVRLLHKGLLYLEAEARWRGEDTTTEPPRLLGYTIQDRMAVPPMRRPAPAPKEPQTPLHTFSTVPRPRGTIPNPPPAATPAARPAEPHPASHRRAASTSTAPVAEEVPPETEDSIMADVSASETVSGQDQNTMQEDVKQESKTSEPASEDTPAPAPVSNKRKERPSPPASAMPSTEDGSQVSNPDHSDTAKTKMDIDIAPSSASLPQKGSADIPSPTTLTGATKTNQQQPQSLPAKSSESDERDAKRAKLEIVTSSATTPAVPEKDTSAETDKTPPTSIPMPPPQPPASVFAPSKSEQTTPVVRTPTVSVVTVRTVAAPRPPAVHSNSTPSSLGQVFPSTASAKPADRRSSSPHASRKDSLAPTPSGVRSSSVGASATKRASSPEVTKRPVSSGGIVSSAPKQRNSRNAPATTAFPHSGEVEPLKKGKGKEPLLGQLSEKSSVITLKGHTHSVSPCSWNPKVPNMLATGSLDGTARIWDVPTSPTSDKSFDITESVVCKHGAGTKKIEVPVVAWNPDGTLLATGAQDGIARIWTPAGDLVLVLSMHTGGIYSLKWNKSGTMLLTGSLDGSVCCWELSSGKVKQQFETHSESVLDCDWYDEQIFASCGMDKAVHLCSIHRQVPIYRFRGHRDEVNCCRFDPSRALLATASDDKTVRIWSLTNTIPGAPKVEEGQETTEIDKQEGCFVLNGHTADVNTLAWHPLGGIEPGHPRLLASGSFDETAKIWDADKGTCLRTLVRNTDVVYSLSFLPTTGQYLALGSNDRRASVFRVSDGELICEYVHSGGVYEAVWHPTREQLAITGQYNEVKIVRALLSS